MRGKTILTVALLLFVAASLVTVIVKQARSPAPSQGPARATPASATAVSGPPTKVIAYYFHGKTRCPTCESIEAYSHEAITGAFGDQLKQGKLEWQVVDYEQPANEHYTSDYDLAAPTLVLVALDGGTQRRWKNLMQVWELVGEKPKFLEFVKTSVQAFLDGSATD